MHEINERRESGSVQRCPIRLGSGRIPDVDGGGHHGPGEGYFFFFCGPFFFQPTRTSVLAALTLSSRAENEE